MNVGLFGCGRCPVRWSGILTCHCGGCHVTFTGMQSFDAHRRGGVCTKPEDVRHHETGERLLTLTNRAYPCWGSTEVDDRWTRGQKASAT